MEMTITGQDLLNWLSKLSAEDLQRPIYLAEEDAGVVRSTPVLDLPELTTIQKPFNPPENLSGQELIVWEEENDSINWTAGTIPCSRYLPQCSAPIIAIGDKYAIVRIQELSDKG